MHTLEHIGRCDLFVVNDAEIFSRIPKHIASKIDAILVPYRPHVNLKPTDTLFQEFMSRLHGFDGTVFVYNLKTSAPSDDYITLEGGELSALHTGLRFIAEHASNLKHINIVGCGGTGYHPLFVSSYSSACIHAYGKNPAKFYNMSRSNHLLGQAVNIIKKYSQDVPFSVQS